KLSYPLAPLVLAIVIGDKAEDAFRQAMLMSKGSLGIFFGNALVTTLVLAGVVVLLVPVVLQVAHVRTTAKPALGLGGAGGGRGRGKRGMPRLVTASRWSPLPWAIPPASVLS